MLESKSEQRLGRQIVSVSGYGHQHSELAWPVGRHDVSHAAANRISACGSHQTLLSAKQERGEAICCCNCQLLHSPPKETHSTSSGKKLPEATAKLIRTMKELQNNRAAGRKGQDSQESQAAEPAASSFAVMLPVTPVLQKGRALPADDVPTPDQVLKLYGLGSEALETPAASPAEIRGGRKRAVMVDSASDLSLSEVGTP